MICAHLYTKIQSSVEVGKQHTMVVCSGGESAELMCLEFPGNFFL